MAARRQTSLRYRLREDLAKRNSDYSLKVAICLGIGAKCVNPAAFCAGKRARALTDGPKSPLQRQKDKRKGRRRVIFKHGGRDRMRVGTGDGTSHKGRLMSTWIRLGRVGSCGNYSESLRKVRRPIICLVMTSPYLEANLYLQHERRHSIQLR